VFKLDAINFLLNLVGATSVESEDSAHPQVAAIKSRLEEANELVQRRGWWYNTARDIEVDVGSSGLREGILRAVPANKRIIVTGDIFWEVNSANQITSGVVLCEEVIYKLSWGMTPYCIQELIMYVAAVGLVRTDIEDEEKIKGLEVTLKGIEKECKSEHDEHQILPDHEEAIHASINYVLHKLGLEETINATSKRPDVWKIRLMLYAELAATSALGWNYNTRWNFTLSNPSNPNTVPEAVMSAHTKDKSIVHRGNSFIKNGAVVAVADVPLNKAVYALLFVETPVLLAEVIRLKVAIEALLASDLDKTSVVNNLEEELKVRWEQWLVENAKHKEYAKHESPLLVAINYVLEKKGEEEELDETTSRPAVWRIRLDLYGMLAAFAAQGWNYNTRRNFNMADTGTLIDANVMSAECADKSISFRRNGFVKDGVDLQVSSVLLEKAVYHLLFVETPILVVEIIKIKVAIEALLTMRDRGDIITVLREELKVKWAEWLIEDAKHDEYPEAETDLLNAVNYVLRRIGKDIALGETTTRPEVREILLNIYKAKADVQATGWHFNTKRNFTHFGNVPNNVLSLELRDKSKRFTGQTEDNFGEVTGELCERAVYDLDFQKIPNTLQDIIKTKVAIDLMMDIGKDTAYLNGELAPLWEAWVEEDSRHVEYPDSEGSLLAAVNYVLHRTGEAVTLSVDSTRPEVRDIILKLMKMKRTVQTIGWNYNTKHAMNLSGFLGNDVLSTELRDKTLRQVGATIQDYNGTVTSGLCERAVYDLDFGDIPENLQNVIKMKVCVDCVLDLKEAKDVAYLSKEIDAAWLVWLEQDKLREFIKPNSDKFLLAINYCLQLNGDRLARLSENTEPNAMVVKEIIDSLSEAYQRDINWFNRYTDMKGEEVLLLDNVLDVVCEDEEYIWTGTEFWDLELNKVVEAKNVICEYVIYKKEFNDLPLVVQKMLQINAAIEYITRSNKPNVLEKLRPLVYIQKRANAEVHQNNLRITRLNALDNSRNSRIMNHYRSGMESGW